jgi:hypothetical protein
LYSSKADFEETTGERKYMNTKFKELNFESIRKEFEGENDSSHNQKIRSAMSRLEYNSGSIEV